MVTGNSSCRILICGDSIARGVIYDDEKNKYRHAHNSFSNLLKSRPSLTIANRAKFGQTVTRVERDLDDLVERTTPHMALLSFGGNDCDFDWPQIAKQPNKPHQPKTTPHAFERGLYSILSKLRSKRIIPMLLTMPPIDAVRYFQWIGQGNEHDQKQILAFLGSEYAIYTWHEKYNLHLLSLARRMCITVIDIRHAFLSCRDWKDLLCIDGIHPNERGHRVIADTILPYVDPCLERSIAK